jgi:predicted PurR-regulated permease PerM
MERQPSSASIAFFHPPSSILHLRRMNPPTKRQARLMWAAVTWLSIATMAALVGVAIWGLGLVVQILAPVLWPLAVAGVLAYLLDPAVDWFEHKGLSRAKAVVCVFAIAVLIIAGLAASVLPQMISESRDLVSRIPTYTRRVEARVQDWIDHPPGLAQKFMKRAVLPPLDSGETTSPTAADNPGTNAAPATAGSGQSSAAGRGLDKESLQNAAANWVARALPKFGSWFLGQVTKAASWFGVLVGLVLIPVYLFYLLLEKRGIKSTWTDYLPVSDSGFKTELVFVLNAINDLLITFFRGQVLVAICDGILYTVGFLIIGLPYAVLAGVMAVFLTIVPFIGAIVVCALALLI